MIRLDVDYLLELDLPFFQDPNQRRGGWSGVSLVECGKHKYFVKRQCNHTYREPRRLYRRTPTLRREHRNMLRVRRLGLVTPDIILYGERGRNAVLVTGALEGYVDLVTWLADSRDSQARHRFFQALIAQLQTLHGAGFHHGCLYGSHIMVKAGTIPAIAFLDLENLRWTPRRAHNASKDIGQLFRHTEGLTETGKEMIVDAYRQTYPGFEAALANQLTKGKRF